jgi:hypothetical protein
MQDCCATPPLVLFALLRFTLQRLYAERQLVGSRRRLTYAAYAALGGITGAIDHVAERAVRGLGTAEIAALPRVLRHLVAPISGSVPALGGPLAMRSAVLADLDVPMRRLVAALVDGRLLLHFIERGTPKIRLAHPAVLENWQRARAIMTAAPATLRTMPSTRRGRWRGGCAPAALIRPTRLSGQECQRCALTTRKSRNTWTRATVFNSSG